MKKILCLITLMLLLCTSCTDMKNDDPFSKFAGDFSAIISLTCNGNASEFELTRTVNSETDNSEFIMTFTAPERLSGYVISSDGESCKLRLDDIEIDASSIAFFPKMLATLFDRDKNSVSSIGMESLSGEQLTAVNTADIKYLFYPDGTPHSASGVACGRSFELTFNNFTPKN